MQHTVDLIVAHLTMPHDCLVFIADDDGMVIIRERDIRGLPNHKYSVKWGSRNQIFDLHLFYPSIEAILVAPHITPALQKKIADWASTIVTAA